MTEKSEACVVSCMGAVVGAMMAYMFFTNRGRELRRSFEPALEDFARELNHFRGTVSKAAGVAADGWNLLNEAIGETGSAAPRFSNPHQTSPF